MSSRAMLLFITGPEFCQWIRQVLEKHPLSLIIDRGEILEPWPGADADILACRRVFLAHKDADIVHRASDALAPERAGWVALDVPEEKDWMLFICQAGAKSDWWDREHQVMRDDPAGVKLFDKVRPSLRKRLSYPIWCRNAMSGSAAPYRTIGYTAGAARLYAEGWELRQKGVANTRFEIRGGTPGS